MELQCTITMYTPVLHCVFMQKQSSFWLTATTDMCLSAFYWTSSQSAAKLFNPAKVHAICQAVENFTAHSTWIQRHLGFHQNRFKRLCLSPFIWPGERYSQPIATKLPRKLKSYVSAFSLSNWVCLDFAFKVECFLFYLTMGKRVAIVPVYECLICEVEARCPSTTSVTGISFSNTFDRISDAKINHQVNI